MKIMQRDCLNCSVPLRGRIDQRFCSDQCRVSFHNSSNRAVSKFMSNISNILRKNRRILAELNHTGKSKVSKAQLLDEGFKFSYFTNEYRTKSGKAYHFCFEQGYLEIERDIFALVVKHEYVE